MRTSLAYQTTFSDEIHTHILVGEILNIFTLPHAAAAAACGWAVEGISLLLAIANRRWEGGVGDGRACPVTAVIYAGLCGMYNNNPGNTISHTKSLSQTGQDINGHTLIKLYR